ncbi:MAG: hypothetical protein WA985_00015 [Erythrobacter sp.]
MRAVFSWLARTSFLYVLLVFAIGLAVVLGPLAPDLADTFRDETAGMGEVRRDVANAQDDAQERLEDAVTQARELPEEALERRIAERERERDAIEARIADLDEGLLAAYRPSRIVERKRAEIELALIERELDALGAALRPRALLEDASAFLERNPQVPTRGAVAAARERCEDNRRALAEFNRRYPIEQRVRELVGSERTRLSATARESCSLAEQLRDRRERGLSAAARVREARDTLNQLESEPLPADFADDISQTVLRDILTKALIALLGILLLPFAWRTLAFHVLAPIAERSAPLKFAAMSGTEVFAPARPSSVSLEVVLQQREDALVRQGYLQSSSISGSKRTRWLLDWSRPFTSLASGLRFVTEIGGAGERVSVSAVGDPLAEVAMLEVPAGASVVLRPSSLAAVIEDESRPLRITSHWRVFSLPAWLTLQLRFLVFHGPARLVLKGGRGVRIEPAERGRIVGQRQLIGLSAANGYSVIRTETFWPYFFGREKLLKDRVEPGPGIVMIEEAPLAGSSGLARGFKGGLDALLKLFGV